MKNKVRDVTVTVRKSRNGSNVPNWTRALEDGFEEIHRSVRLASGTQPGIALMSPDKSRMLPGIGYEGMAFLVRSSLEISSCGLRESELERIIIDRVMAFEGEYNEAQFLADLTTAIQLRLERTASVYDVLFLLHCPPLPATHLPTRFLGANISNGSKVFENLPGQLILKVCKDNSWSFRQIRSMAPIVIEVTATDEGEALYEAKKICSAFRGAVRVSYGPGLEGSGILGPFQRLPSPYVPLGPLTFCARRSSNNWKLFSNKAWNQPEGSKILVNPGTLFLDFQRFLAEVPAPLTPRETLVRALSAYCFAEDNWNRASCYLSMVSALEILSLKPPSKGFDNAMVERIASYFPEMGPRANLVDQIFAIKMERNKFAHEAEFDEDACGPYLLLHNILNNVMQQFLNISIRIETNSGIEALQRSYTECKDKSDYRRIFSEAIGNPQASG